MGRPTRLRVIVRYYVVSISTLALTITCPGTTVLWLKSNASNENNNDDSLSLLSSASQQRATRILWWTVLTITYICSLVSFHVLQGSDPGYLCSHRHQHQEEIQTKIDQTVDDPPYSQMSDHMHQSSTINPLHIDHSTNLPQYQKESFRHEVHVTQRKKYCTVCGINPPIRSHHCRTCNNCVATFDHHCHIVDTCIGERNHCQFYWFLLSQFVVCVVCLIVTQSSSVNGMVQQFLENTYKASGKTSYDNPNNRDWETWFETQRVIVANLLLGTLIFASGIMVVLHTVLIVTNCTTFEYTYAKHIDYLKNTSVGNNCCPFSRGIYLNVHHFCCERSRTSTSHPWQPIKWYLPKCEKEMNDLHDPKLEGISSRHVV